MIVSLGISALLGIVVFLFGDFGDMEFRLLLTTLTVGGYSVTGLCCAVVYERRRFTSLALTGMIVSVFGFLFTVSVIWKAIAFEASWEALLIFIILAFSTAHSCLLLLIESDETIVNPSLSATITFIAIVALMLIVLVVLAGEVYGFYYRLLGVFAILDVLGTVVTPILDKVSPSHG